jgi:hypothetical protein
VSKNPQPVREPSSSSSDGSDQNIPNNPKEFERKVIEKRLHKSFPYLS